jgi:hypothetical protein
MEVTTIVVTLMVEIDGGPETDEGELSQLTSQLRRRLLELDVESVESPLTTAPPRTRSGNSALVGVLLVTVTPALLRGAVAVVHDWLARSQARSVKMQLDGDTLELTGISAEDQQRMIASFLDRHANEP